MLLLNVLFVLFVLQAEKTLVEATNKLDLLHMSLERRIAEINPAAAQVGIYNEKLLPSPKSRNREKVAAVTGKLEVCYTLVETILSKSIAKLMRESIICHGSNVYFLYSPVAILSYF